MVCGLHYCLPLWKSAVRILVISEFFLTGFLWIIIYLFASTQISGLYTWLEHMSSPLLADKEGIEGLWGPWESGSQVAMSVCLYLTSNMTWDLTLCVYLRKKLSLLHRIGCSSNKKLIKTIKKVWRYFLPTQSIIIKPSQTKKVKIWNANYDIKTCYLQLRDNAITFLIASFCICQIK